MFYLRLIFVAYGKVAWSFLVMVEMWFGLSCLWWKVSLVFFAYGSSRPEIGCGLFTYGSPTEVK